MVLKRMGRCGREETEAGRKPLEAWRVQESVGEVCTHIFWVPSPGLTIAKTAMGRGWGRSAFFFSPCVCLPQEEDGKRCIYQLLPNVNASHISTPHPIPLSPCFRKQTLASLCLTFPGLGATVACTEKNLVSAQNSFGRLVCFVIWSYCYITLEFKLAPVGIFKINGNT